jgi:phospholipase A1
MKRFLTLALFILVPLFAFAENKPDLSPMESYKGNSFLFGDMKDQVKVQVSFKYSIMQEYDTGIFLGYSQYMNWRLYSKSSPFADINYNPEVFVKSKYFIKDYIDYVQWAPYEHMSNGRDDKESRGIDRTYIEGQWSKGNKLNVGVNLKGYLYYAQGSGNKKYASYTKYYEAKFFLSFGEEFAEDSKDQLYVKVAGWDKGYQEVGVISRKLPKINPRLYLQFFNGYCSSLLDYDKKEQNIRIGLIFK